MYTLASSSRKGGRGGMIKELDYFLWNSLCIYKILVFRGKGSICKEKEEILYFTLSKLFTVQFFNSGGDANKMLQVRYR